MDLVMRPVRRDIKAHHARDWTPQQWVNAPRINNRERNGNRSKLAVNKHLKLMSHNCKELIQYR
jgi:hypothetical protein